MEMPPLPVLYLYQDKLSLSTLFTRTWAFLCLQDLVILLKLLRPVKSSYLSNMTKH